MIIAAPASPSVLALASQANGFDTLRPYHQDQAEAGIDRLRDATAREGRDALGAALETHAGEVFFSFLCGNSPHLSLLLQRDLELTQALVAEPPDAITAHVRGELAGADPALDRDQLMTFLRRQRNRVAVLAAVYDCFDIRGVMECAELLSDMADHAVRLTVSHLLLDRVERGDLEPPDGDRWGYFVLAMGKHGSRELNYSSDIDLIVLYDPESARYTGSRTLNDCFVRVTQDLVRILQTRTADGYVFRTDLRLRPDPSSTPVAITVDFALNYYRRFGRTWERTALIKARPVAGDLTAGDAYLERLSPFIWDEALDFTSVEEIRSVSQQIHDFHGHGAVRAAGHNVKLGRGGIREIEFFVHMHQLAHGGRNRRLRGARLLPMLETLDREHHIMPRETAALRDAYLLLRRVEHRLQMVNDAQTQKLPESDEGLEHIAAFMGLDSAEELVHGGSSPWPRRSTTSTAPASTSRRASRTSRPPSWTDLAWTGRTSIPTPSRSWRRRGSRGLPRRSRSSRDGRKDGMRPLVRNGPAPSSARSSTRSSTPWARRPIPTTPWPAWTGSWRPCPKTSPSSPCSEPTRGSSTSSRS